jgi:hypothetical protein
MPKQYAARLNLVEENGDLVMYCEIKESRRSPFKRIAKRYSKQSWISLEPGYTVVGDEPGTTYGRLEIFYTPINAQSQ